MPALTIYTSGFTLTELMVVAVIIAAVSTLAVPSFVDTIACTRLRAASEQLQASLGLARSEAMRRGGRVTLCRSAQALQCDAVTQAGCLCELTAGDWSSGWIAYDEGALEADESKPRVDPGERVIQIVPGLSHVVIKGNSTISTYASFLANGRPQSNSGAFQAGTLCLTESKFQRRRALVLNAAGRVTLLRPDSGDSSSSCPSIAKAEACQ